MKHLKEVLYILIISGLIMSTYIAYEDYTGNYLCITGQSCQKVQTSEYGKILGIKVAYIGILGFLALLSSLYFSMKSKRSLIIFITLASIGAMSSVYFIFIQGYILKEWCSNCLIVDTIMLLIYANSLPYWKKYKNKV